jgi:hypothetical protein
MLELADAWGLSTSLKSNLFERMTAVFCVTRCVRGYLIIHPDGHLPCKASSQCNHKARSKW